MGPKKRSFSQPATPSRQKKNRYSNTQPNIDESFRGIANITNDELNELANECVRFIIYRGGQQLPFRKAELQKHIKGATGRIFDKVLDIASNILDKVYGFKMILCDGGSKFYILSNNLPYIEEDLDNEQMSELPTDRKKILLMLVLIHIFMSTSSVTQASLYSFLQSLYIDPERRHEIFGDVKEYINTTLVKQHYLNVDKDAVSQEISYQWGDRAEKEISKMDLLQLVCKIFKAHNPKSWVTQYKEASEQPVENHRNKDKEAEGINDAT
ncbi:non-structural maintenance of chromosomes element 3 homolog [Coccinella septempunctata]|uniref:non-structural maintenance of chromosomes element 3 homolog n=1 Tax=Coccinella septempunctata TaxID=41139 RepID=UPI001D06B1ED|nr:non-structural maintenance of chromosomes element 3 homolog [Coccinella septempunctata]